MTIHHSSSSNGRLTVERGRFRPRLDSSCYDGHHAHPLRQVHHPARSLDQSPRGRGNHQHQKHHGNQPNNTHQKRPQYYKSSAGHQEHDFTPFSPPDPGEKCSYTNEMVEKSGYTSLDLLDGDCVRQLPSCDSSLSRLPRHHAPPGNQFSSIKRQGYSSLGHVRTNFLRMRTTLPSW